MDNSGSPAMVVDIQSYMTVSEFTFPLVPRRRDFSLKQPLIVTALTKAISRQ